MVSLSIIGIVISILYFYFYNTYTTLQGSDRDIIEKTLNPDTEGRGYSDKGKLALDHDIDFLSKNSSLSAEDLVITKYYYDQYLKSFRKILLSEDKEVFIRTYILNLKSFKCLTNYFTKSEIKDFFDLVFFQDLFFGGESRKIAQYSDILFDKHFMMYSYQEKHNLLNLKMNFDDCEKLR